MQTCRQGSERILWQSVCNALCQPLNYSALTWRTILFTGYHRAWQRYMFANLIVKFSFKALSKRSIPMSLFYAHAEQIEWLNENLPHLAIQNQLHVSEYAATKNVTWLKAACYLRPWFFSVFQCYSVSAILHKCSSFDDSETKRNQGSLIWRSIFRRYVVSVAA